MRWRDGDSEQRRQREDIGKSGDTDQSVFLALALTPTLIELKTANLVTGECGALQPAPPSGPLLPYALLRAPGKDRRGESG